MKLILHNLVDDFMENLLECLRDTLALAKIVGQAPAFLEVIRPLPTVAKSDATVLITGETGTGKELVARAIHYLSPRAAFPFVPVNCGRLPDTLVEDEFFGHKRGAFTDAHTPRPGLIAEAKKGTLFLDEVEALTPKAQVVLLRVLQDKLYRAIGSDHKHEADVRIIAATNAPLEQIVRAGGYRNDLYYRLCVFSINLPPLRDRREDILLLAQHFLKKYISDDRPALMISPAAGEALISYDWPGNVRELENAIIRGINFCQTDCIVIGDLGIPSPTETSHVAPIVNLPELYSFKEMKKRIVETFEREYLNRLMYKHHGNVSRAAFAAGKERRDLSKLLKKHQIDPKLFHEPSS